jgi:CRP-like cAMP-binding protein
LEARFKNTILSRLEPETIERLSLTFVDFKLGHEFEFPGNKIDHLIFVEEGMASMTTTFEDGAQVEVGMFGYESVIGISALMGTKQSLNRVYTQVEGSGYISPIKAGREEFERAGLFQKLALRYVQAQLVQTMQSAGCNAKHHIEQRLARWLLITADRVHCNSFFMPQEFLADMVGSTRSTVSRAASILKDEGLIDYNRGQVSLTDPTALRKRACECYAIIKDHLDNYAAFGDESEA